MKSSDLVMELLSEHKRSKRSLAFELGISPQALDHRLSTSPRVDTLISTLRPLGYKIVAVPIDAEITDAQVLEG
jgi:DNA-binding phage protein